MNSQPNNNYNYKQQYQTKRQTFANQHRQRHRQAIFKKHRNCYEKEEREAMGIQNEKKNMQELGASFLFQKEVLEIGDILSQGREEEFGKLVASGEIEKVLSVAPKWLSSLSQSVPSSPTTQPILHTLCLLCSKLLHSSPPQLPLPTLNTLIELASLPGPFLEAHQLPESVLASQFVPLCRGMLGRNSNMQVVFGGVYVCGNLLEGWYRCQTDNAKGNGNETGEKRGEMEMEIVGKMEEICHKYPNYQNCMQIMLWFMRSCLLLSTTKNHNNNNNTIALQTYFLHILHKVILTLCSKFTNPEVNLLTYSQNDFQYYYKIMDSGFYLLYVICSEERIYYQVEDSQNGGEKGKGKKIYKANQGLDKIIGFIDGSVTTYLDTFYLNPNPIHSHIEHKTHHKTINHTITLLSQSLSQTIFYLTNLQPSQNLLPNSILTLSLLASKGIIKNTASIQLCEKMLDVCINNNDVTLNKIAIGIVKSFVGNLGEIMRDKQIVFDRDYRVSVLGLVGELQDWISAAQFRDIILELIQQDKGQQKKEGLMPQQPLHSTKSQAHNLRTQYQPHLLSTFLPPLLNMLPLLLIDQDSTNRALALKILYKLLINWQIEVEGLRHLLFSMDIAGTVLDLQEDKEEIVYNGALDVIEEFRLDQDQ